MWETQVQSLGLEDLLEKEMATQSTVLFLKKSFIYLAVLGLSYDVWGLLSSCAAWAYLPYGTWDLRSLTRDGTCVPCIGRRILNHWTTREVPTQPFCVRNYILPILLRSKEIVPSQIYFRFKAKE